MRFALMAVVLASVLTSVLAGCVATPEPAPTRSDPGLGTCDVALYVDAVDPSLAGSSAPLPEPGFPFADLSADGVVSTCTGHFSVTGGAAGGSTAPGREFDAALYDVPLAELERRLTAVAGTEWAEGGILSTLEIEEGVLVLLATAPATCDGSVFSDNVAVPMEVTATELVVPPFPLDGLFGEVEVSCTAHLTVDYTESDQVVEFDILVAGSSLDELAGALEPIVKGAGWERDSDLVLWRDPVDQEGYVQAIEISDGVLVGVAAGS